MSIIFITEKPAVAEEYQKVLKLRDNYKGKGYFEDDSPVMKSNVIITWAVGHLFDICEPEEHNPAWGGAWRKENLPMIPKEFKYKPQKDTEKQFEIVKSLYTRDDIDGIYYAGDSGREGIYIQALIRNQIFETAPKFSEKVVWIDSYTEKAILNGIQTAKPYSDYQPMIDSGYSRAIADWLIGLNFTRSFTLTSGTLINVGRVLTPTLTMVVNRQKEIDDFVKTDYYGVKADKFASWKAFKESHYYDSPLLYNDTGFKKKETADTLASGCNLDRHLTVEQTKVQTKTEYAPYLFNLADLQAYCSKHFQISPAQTLQYAQTLYEHKFTTYPRTDCRFLSTAVADDLKAKGYLIPKRYIDDGKVTDHYAIIPTLQGNESSLSGTEKRVYEAIKKRFDDTMKPPFIYDAVSVTYLHKNGERFFESYRIIKQKGFKEDDKQTEDISVKSAIPNKGEIVSVTSFTTYNMETRPPSSYTTGTLIMAMEKAGKLIEDEELREQIKTCGIGTSATRAKIIDTLTDKKFILVDSKQKITPTEFGKKVIPLIAKYDEALTSPVKTADMENRLSAIVENTLSKEQYIEYVEQYVTETTQKILKMNTESLSNYGTNPSGKGKIYQCPKCGGEVIKGQYGFFCKAKCGMNLTKVYGHTLTDNQVEKLLSGAEISYTANGRKTTVVPSVRKNSYQGKTYYNWDTKSSSSTTKKFSEKSGWSSWGKK